ncbi:MAG: GC-type dockerin domain-anchored protein [Phycisphaerales bacterium]
MLGMQRSHRLISSAAALVLSAGAASAVPPLQHYYGVVPTTGVFQTYTDQITAAAQVKWYAFALTDSVSAAEGTYLDIDTNANPAPAPAMVDTVIGVYNAAGQYVTFDDDSGTGNRSQVSFGAGSRSAPGNGQPYNGQDGATLNAAQGPFFVAVSGYHGFYAPNFGATSDATELGYFTLGIRAGKMPGFAPTVDADLGNIRGHRSSMSTGAMPVTIGEVKWVKFHIDTATDASTVYCDIQTAGSNLPVANGSNLNDAELALFRSDGTVVSGNGNADDWTFGGGTFQGGASFGRTTGARSYGGGLSNFAGQTSAVLTQGDYYVAVGAYNLVPQNGFVAGSDTDASGTVTLNVLTNVQPAQDYDMGRIRTFNSPQTTTKIPLADGDTKWYRFEIEQATSAATTYCDIHTLGSTLATGPGVKDDTMIAVYNTDGVLKGFNDDWPGRTTGGNESGVSFGRTSGPRTYGGLPNFAGLDGAVLPAGVYFVGVTGYDADLQGGSGADYRLKSDHNRHGQVQLTISTNMGDPLQQDLGIVSRANSPVSTTVFAVPDLGIKWIHFKTVKATNASELFLDMHTYGSTFTTGPSSGNDNEIGLYDPAGTLIATNDDWTFGVGTRWEAALSFGATSDPRNHATHENFAGQHGAILYPNDYYVAVVGFDTSFANGFGVTPNNGTAGTAKLTIITNLPAKPCNLADVASLGGTAGADGVLTVDDIVFFLSRFFGADVAVADVASLGGTPGADGIITVDDLVVFLAAFFSPCNP